MPMAASFTFSGFLEAVLSFFSFACAEDAAQVIEQAQGMTLEELFKKAIEESNGKDFYAVGNSSRGKSALPLFVEELQKIDPSYTLNWDWQQPKENKIFDQLEKDVNGANHVMSMTLIQDGNQIQSKMLDTGLLLNFVPADWQKRRASTGRTSAAQAPADASSNRTWRLPAIHRGASAARPAP